VRLTFCLPKPCENPHAIPLRAIAYSVCAVFALACQGEYPLEPTRCDAWCRATMRAGCEYDWPDTCVVDCENLGLVPPGEECGQLFDKLVDCFQSVPDDKFHCEQGRSVPDAPICARPHFDLTLSCRL
jgi:hypothetical protein